MDHKLCQLFSRVAHELEGGEDGSEEKDSKYGPQYLFFGWCVYEVHGFHFYKTVAGSESEADDVE